MEELDISEIKTADVLLVSSKSKISKLIQKFEGNKWSHSAIFWWCYDELFVIEASDYGIAITPFTSYLNSTSDLLLLKPKIEIKGSEYGKFMLPYVGHTPYNYFELMIAQPIYIITDKKIWLGNKDNKKFICSEFVAFVYNHFNSHIFQEWDKTIPMDLYNSTIFNHYNIKRNE